MFERKQPHDESYNHRRQHYQPSERERGGRRWSDNYEEQSASEFDERFARGSRDMRERGQPEFERDRGQQQEWEGPGRSSDFGRDERDFSARGSRGRAPYEHNYDLAHEGQQHRDRDREKIGPYPSQRLSPAPSGFSSRSGDYSSGGRDRYFDSQPGPQDRSSSFSERGDAFAGAGQSMRGKGPKGYQRSDERIREEVCDELTRHHGIDASSIEVEVKQGEVTLKGYVQRRQEKYMAEDLCEGIMGVRDVHNFLRVGHESQKEALERPDTNLSATQAQL